MNIVINDHFIKDKFFSLFSRLAIDAALLEPLLEGYSVNEALSSNKLFITDLEILDGNTCRVEKVRDLLKSAFHEP
jgi:hypothetical protein